MTICRGVALIVYTEKLKPIGRKRVRKSFSGWLRINVQPKLSVCGRRRGGVVHGQPVVLLLRVTDVDRTAAIDFTQLISTPAECNSAERMDADDDRLGNDVTPSLAAYSREHYSNIHQKTDISKLGTSN